MGSLGCTVHNGHHHLFSGRCRAPGSTVVGLGLLALLTCCSALTVDPLAPRSSRVAAPQLAAPGTHHGANQVLHPSTTRRLTLSGGSPLETQTSDSVGEHESSEDNSRSLSPETLSSEVEGTLTLKAIPNMKQLLRFMIPTFGVYLANPIMSIIDTATVGQLCSREQLAALGPSTAACDMLVFLVNFMPVATTTMLAQALAKKDSYEARKVVSSAYSISIASGLFLTTLIFVAGTPVLKLFLGSSADSNDLLPYALRYAYWRGIGLPATVLGMSAQAACIAAKDAESPFWSVILQAVVNTVLDFLLVGPLKGGVTGAAIATTISQLVATGFLLMRVERNMATLEEETVAPAEQGTEGEKPLKRTKSSMEFPSVNEVVKFWSFAGPIFLITFGRSYCWSILTPGAASAGTVALAAHQIIINIYFFFSMAGHAVFQTVQAFLPAHQEEQKRAKQVGGEIHKKATANVRNLAKKLLVVAGAVGVIQMGISLVPTLLVPGVFCRDSAIIAAVKKESMLLAWTILPHTAIFALEALLINGKDTDFLGISFVAFSLGWTWVVRVISQHHRDLTVLWKSMVVFAYLRGFIWGGRLLYSGAEMGIPLLASGA